MEINGRVWGSMALAVRAGVDFPTRLVELHLGSERKSERSTSDYALGTRSRNLRLDLVWIAATIFGKRRYPFLSAPTRLAGVRALLSLFDPRSKFDILSLDDPRPGMLELKNVMHDLLEKAIAHLFPAISLRRRAARWMHALPPHLTEAEAGLQH